jgi:hypothetical protein
MPASSAKLGVMFLRPRMPAENDPAEPNALTQSPQLTCSLTPSSTVPSTRLVIIWLKRRLARSVIDRPLESDPVIGVDVGVGLGLGVGVEVGVGVGVGVDVGVEVGAEVGVGVGVSVEVGVDVGDAPGSSEAITVLEFVRVAPPACCANAAKGSI